MLSKSVREVEADSVKLTSAAYAVVRLDETTHLDVPGVENDTFT